MQMSLAIPQTGLTYCSVFLMIRVMPILVRMVTRSSRPQRLIVSHEKGFGLHMHFVMHQPVGHLDQRFYRPAYLAFRRREYPQHTASKVHNLYGTVGETGYAVDFTGKGWSPADWSPVVDESCWRFVSETESQTTIQVDVEHGLRWKFPGFLGAGVG